MILSEYEHNLILESLDRITEGNPFKSKKIVDIFKDRLVGKDGLTRWLGERDVQFFAKYYLPDIFYNEFGKHHVKMFKEIDKVQNNELGLNKLLLVLFRGASKSTVGNVLLTMHDLLYKKDYFIVEVSATKETANTFINTIKMEVTENERIKRDFGSLKGPVWKAGELVLSNDNCVKAYGITSNFRGVNYRSRRPHKIVIDDLESEDKMGTPEQRTKLFNRFKEVVLPLGKNNETKLIFLGTITHSDGVVSRLLSSNDIAFEKVSIPAIIKPSDAKELWAEWREIYTGSNCKEDEVKPVEERLDLARKFYEENKEEMMKGVEVVWEDRFDYYSLMVQQTEMGEGKFNKEMMNDPSGDEVRLFTNMKYYENLPEHDRYLKVMFIDTSEGHEGGDFSSITVLFLDLNTGIMYQAYGDLEIRGNNDINLTAYSLIHNEFIDIDAVAYETNGAGFAFEEFKKLFKNSSFDTSRIVPYYQKTNKHERIIDLAAPITNGTIRFNEVFWKYNQNVKDYHKGVAHDDAPDSLQGAVAVLKRIIEEN